MSAPDGYKLTNSLVSHLRGRSKPPIVLSEIALAGTWGSHGRLDVAAITIAPNYGGWHVDGYEVKATRKDLFNDLDAGKWRRYLKCVERFFLAIPAGLAKLEELPKDVGVLTFTGERWQTARRSPSHGGRPDDIALLRVIRRLDQDAEMERRRESKLTRLQRLKQKAEEDLLRYHLSEKAKELIQDADRRLATIESRESHLEEVKASLEGAPELLHDITTLLELVGRCASTASNSIRIGRYSKAEWRDEAAAQVRRAVESLTEALARP